MSEPWYKKIPGFIPAILWAKIILLLCILPHDTFPEENWFDTFHIDKLVHGGLFFILSLLLNYGMQNAGEIKHRFLRILFINACYALLTEFIQKMLTTDRFFEWNDALADIGGSVFALFLLKNLKKPNIFSKK